MNIVKTAALGAATVIVSAGPASAYTLNGDGTGYVGKGEVQTLLELNNKAMQAAHTAVTFKYVATSEVSFDCEWYTGPDHNLSRHHNTKTSTVAVDAVVASESRKTGQWTGWDLSGVPASGSTTAPVVTDADCGAEGNQMKKVVEGSVEVGATTGGLFATYDGVDYLLTESVPSA
jgi:hypothetical protein